MTDNYYYDDNDDDDDDVLLLIDCEPIPVERPLLMQCGDYFQAHLPADSAVLVLDLPSLDLPPFFNRHAVPIHPVPTLRLYLACLRRRAAPDLGVGLERLETRLLASFAILSEHFHVDDLRGAVDAALTHRFGRLLCQATLEFARRCRLPRLQRRSLGALVCRRSYRIEASAGVTLDELGAAMTALACRDPLTELVKFGARLEQGRRSLRAEILHRRRPVVFDDDERLEHFMRWFGAVVAASTRRDQLLYALDVADCVRTGKDQRRLPDVFIEMLTTFVYAQMDALPASS